MCADKSHRITDRRRSAPIWHLSNTRQVSARFARENTQRDQALGRLVAAHVAPRRRKGWFVVSSKVVSHRPFNMGLKKSSFWGCSRAAAGPLSGCRNKESAMSVAEFGLRPESALAHPLPQVTSEAAVDSHVLTTRFEQMSRLARTIASMRPEAFSHVLVALFKPFFPCDFANIVILDPGDDEANCKSLGDEQLTRLDVPVEDTTVWSVFQDQQPLWVVDWQHDERPAVQKEGHSASGVGYRSLCRLPLRTPQGCLGVLSLASSRRHNYADHESYLLLAADQVALGVANLLLQSEVQKLKEGMEDEHAYVENESAAEPSFEEIVGRSPALQRLLRQIEVVAPTDSGVLIQGETGTGKELIAKAIHNRSARRDRALIKVNCAAIPSGLLESELFGHEKGAFTGAIMRKPGRFELADKGTLFLDEVGDIPLELQAKLLRVLQEHEFERLGSTRTQQVDVRVIAATHRDLKKMVEEGTFR